MNGPIFRQIALVDVWEPSPTKVHDGGEGGIFNPLIPLQVCRHFECGFVEMNCPIARLD